MAQQDPDPCVVRGAGIELSGRCGGCDGHPGQGQRCLEPKAVVYLGGAEADAVYCVIEGHLKESVTTVDGRIIGIRLVHPGELFGTECLLGGTYQCTVEALTAARICRVSDEELQTVLHERPEQGLALAQAMGRQLQRLRDSMVRLAAMSAEEKIRAVLEELLGDTEVGEWLTLPLSRQELADLLGLSLPTVSRTVRRFEREGSYEVSGRKLRRV